MADLTFADSHNMVAYMEKSEDNANFVEIVDFLNASPIRYALTVSPTVYVFYIEQFWSTAKIKTINNETQICAKVNGKTIVIIESSVRRDLYFIDEDGITCLTNTEIFENLQLMGGPATLVADETVYEERGDSVERTDTTATSLDAEQGSGGSPRRQDTMGDRPTQTRVLDLENVKDAQALEIKKLKKRVKKLERGNKIDQDEGISWFQEDSETQGRYGHDIGVNTANTSITTASINITTAEPVTTASAPVTTVGVSISSAELKEQGEISIMKGQSFVGNLMKERKKHFARLRAEEQRRKPLTKAQKRNQMSNYLKNIAGYTLQQFRGYSFDKIKTLFETTKRKVNTFVPIESEVDRAVPELAAGSSKRDAEEELDQESSKRQKTDESSKLAEEPRDKEAGELSQEELQ
ncbi:hypothetical protein Tco_0519910 [Tanacetum coccineum]